LGRGERARGAETQQRHFYSPLKDKRAAIPMRLAISVFHLDAALSRATLSKFDK
jgi:hypothetical protein